MTGIIISKIKYFSLAKFLTMYGLLLTFITLVVDLVLRAVTGKSYMVAQATTWSAWVLGAVAQLILVPIIMFILAYIIGFIINVCLKTTKGLEIETL